MNDIPNYSTYHIEELRKALSDIDESKNPEEAKIILEFIEKGGYSYPSNPPIDRVKFVNPIYKWSLIVVLSLFLAFNVYIFVTWGTMISLLPIAIQTTLLYMIFKNHKNVRTLIKVWCVVLLVSAFFGFLSMYYATEIITAKLLDNLFSLAVGLSYLVFADKCVQLIPNGSNK